MLTGITNEMVQQAPKFYEVAKEIFLLTQNKIFVAHNVNFDYTFIRDEFKSLGADFTRKKLCTVRLARKIGANVARFLVVEVLSDLIEHAKGLPGASRSHQQHVAQSLEH